MKIALITSLEKPDGTFDDQLLRDSLVKSGHTAEFRVWNGATDWLSYETCLLRSTWDYHRNVTKFLSWLQTTAKFTRVLNPYETVRWNTDKSYLSDLGTRGIPVIPTQVFTEQSKALTAIAKLLEKGRVVVKPAVSASGELTHRLDSESKLEYVVGEILERSALVLQPYIETIVEEGELSLVFFKISGKTQYSHSVLKTAKKGDFRVQEEFGGTVEKVEAPDDSIAVARNCLETMPQKWTYARVDLVDWTTSPRVGEVELIEPELFFRHHPPALDLMKQALG